MKTEYQRFRVYGRNGCMGEFYSYGFDEEKQNRRNKRAPTRYRRNDKKPRRTMGTSNNCFNMTSQVKQIVGGQSEKGERNE